MYYLTIGGVELAEISFYVGVDIDNVVNDYCIKLLDYYNKKYNDNLQYDKIRTYDFQSYCKPEAQNIFDEFVTDGGLKTLETTKECKTALYELNQKYDLRFVTSSYPLTVKEKSDMLSKWFDWFNPKQLIVCQEKWKLDFDIMIDDHLDFLSGCEHGIIFKQPWNIPSEDDEYSSMLRTNCWNDIVRECDWYYKDKLNYIDRRYLF